MVQLKLLCTSICVLFRFLCVYVCSIAFCPWLHKPFCKEAKAQVYWYYYLQLAQKAIKNIFLWSWSLFLSEKEPGISQKTKNI